MLKIFLEFLDNPNITPRFMDGINEVWLNKVKWKKMNVLLVEHLLNKNEQMKNMGAWKTFFF